MVLRSILLITAVRHASIHMRRRRLHLQHSFPEVDNNPNKCAMRSTSVTCTRLNTNGLRQLRKGGRYHLPLTETAKVYGVQTQAWLGDILKRIPEGKIKQLDELTLCQTQAPENPNLKAKSTPGHTKVLLPSPRSKAVESGWSFNMGVSKSN